MKKNTLNYHSGQSQLDSDAYGDLSESAPVTGGEADRDFFHFFRWLILYNVMENSCYVFDFFVCALKVSRLENPT